MAESAQLAVGASNYVGNAAIGGGSFGSFQLDTKPIEDLARYTMLYNKAEYDQRQKDAETAAKEIADMTSYDLTSGIPKDAKVLESKYDALTNYVNANPGVLNYRNKKEFAEYKKMRNELDNDLSGAKIRNTMWAVRQKEIQDEQDPEMKKILQEELDIEISDTDIRTPIKHTNQYTDQQIILPDAPSLSFEVVKVGPNSTNIRDFNVFNANKARANGDVFALGLDQVGIDPNTPEGKRALLNKKRNFWVQGAESLNAVLPTAKSPNASGVMQFDKTKLPGIAKNLVNLFEETNEYLSQTKKDVIAGVYKDKFEKPITFGDGPLREEDYEPINFEDGVTPEELAMVAQYAKWKGDQSKTKVQQTDNAIQIRGQNETSRHNKATEGIAWGQLNLEKDKFEDGKTKWVTAMKGGETVKNGAMEFAKRLYGDMQKLADKKGVISPENLRQLNQEQLKYLGTQVINTNENTGVVSVSQTPMVVGENDAIQLVNGEIKVMKDARKLADGTFAGAWDQTRTSNIFNIGTNRLNEQLKNAGAKELNSYMPIDMGIGGISTNTIGGVSSASGSSTGQSNSTQTKAVRTYRGLDANGNPIYN